MATVHTFFFLAGVNSAAATQTGLCKALDKPRGLFEAAEALGACVLCVFGFCFVSVCVCVCACVFCVFGFFLGFRAWEVTHGSSKFLGPWAGSQEKPASWHRVPPATQHGTESAPLLVK